MYNQEFKNTEIRYLQSHGDCDWHTIYCTLHHTPCHLQVTATKQHKKHYNHRPGDQYT